MKDHLLYSLQCGIVCCSSTGNDTIFPRTVQNGSGAHPASELFAKGHSGQSVNLTTSIYSRGYERVKLHPPPPPHAFTARMATPVPLKN